MSITIDTNRLIAELHHLATFTEPAAEGAAGPGDTAVTRVVFTERDREARTYLSSLAAAAGLTERVDAIGNTFFRWAGSEPELPAVATGSHVDAIPNAGMYDGTVGVLGGLEAIRALQAAGFRPRRSIELILFTSEEPTRFGIGCLGSRMMSGALAPQAARALRDAKETALEDVRMAAGFGGSLDGVRLARDHYAAFVELHIEQGPLLEAEGLAIGIVTAIAAPASARITLTGLGGHAGALLMPDRRDALAAAAEIILSVEHAARGTGVIDTVATVGMCEVFPGAVNSVPSRVHLSLDVRDIDEARRDLVLHEITAACADTARNRDLTIVCDVLNADAPAACAPGILDAIVEACTEADLSSRTMVSRAYHDALFMARVCPVAMIFIPCRSGVSHRPDEYSSPQEIARGSEVLARTLQLLSGSWLLATGRW